MARKKIQAPSLETEIESRRQEIKTDSYAMSIGELASLYKENELNIHPEFQRFFRWTPIQKSNFIESLLLGIPIPSIFLSQTPKGTWEVVDGLQRLSTIFQTMGILKNPKGELQQRLILRGTKYLGELGGKWWPSSEHESKDRNALSGEVQLLIKRAKLDLKIVLRETASSGKYELFRRLNTGGSLATDQEVRSCVTIMTDATFFEWQNELASDENFRKCVPISDRLENEQYHLELVTRFLVFRRWPSPKRSELDELGEFLTDRITQLAEDKAYDRDGEGAVFRRTFSELAAVTEDDTFKKYNFEKMKFSGSFLISAFEAIAVGVSMRKKKHVDLEKMIKILWKDDEFLHSIGSGVSAADRIPQTLPIGRRLFAS